ncbi:hypothetical protein [Helicobacter cinaedi]|nr:hypothetical protein [Helicobacter cinaedi]
MIQTHINTNNTDFTYTNTTDLGQNIFVTGTVGLGILIPLLMTRTYTIL